MQFDAPLGAIDTIYAAATGTAGWNDALKSIASATGGRELLVLPVTAGVDGLTLFTPDLTDAIADYVAEWRPFDLRRQRALDLGIGVGMVTDRILGIDEACRAHDPFVQEFLRDLGLCDFAAETFRARDGRLYSVAVQRDLDAGTFSDDEVRLVSVLGRHLVRAIDIALDAASAAASAVAPLDGFERLGHGTVVFDEAGRVGEMSRRADALIGTRLAGRGGARADEVRLAGFVAAVAAHLRGAAAPEPIVLAGGGDEPPVLLQAVPTIVSQGHGLFAPLVGRRGVVVLVDDLSGRDGRDVTPLLRGLGLTANEARIAREVGSGASPREVAERLDLSEHTVRFVLKTVFTKLDVRKQSELAVMVTRLGARLAERD